MAAINTRQNFIEGVAPRSLPATPISRKIGCVRCVKRLEKDLGHKCVKKPGMIRCNHCRGQNYKCVPVSASSWVIVSAHAFQMPRFFFSTAHALTTDAAAIAATRKPDAGVVRALRSRVRGFRKRIVRRGLVSASLMSVEDFRAEMVVQMTRIADYMARLVRIAVFEPPPS